MEAQSPINGSYTQKGNYLWGGALTIAWKQLSKSIIKSSIKINSKNEAALQIADKYNKLPFDAHMLSESCYYARAGFGNETVNLINNEVSKKFPEKTTQKLQPNLGPEDIISYAYFFKNMKFKAPFNNEDIYFNKVKSQGFTVKTSEQRRQVLVHNYSNDQKFIIELETKAEKDHIFILKSQKQIKPAEVLQKINGISKAGVPLQSDDMFMMPKISISHRRNVNELQGVFLANPGFQTYRFSQIYEIIKLDIDETGVKVENEGAIMIQKCCLITKPKKIRRFILDRPFWIVIREGNKYPYFVAYIKCLNDK